ncbi:MAG: hypothetical protein RJA22_501 [Verrucomicrobiota bacterium]
MSDGPTFSIVTPSFRSGAWLRQCIASVADQGVSVEHLVQDAGSDDGTQEWLPRDPRVRAVIEKDRGMYDAINRGLRRAGGRLLAYLNADEQYLPGALARVERFFAEHPAVEVVFADVIVVGPDGGYVCDRRASLPTRWHSLVSGNLAILTAATFFRRSLLDRHGLFFDDTRRTLADALWVLELLDRGVPMAVLPEFTTVFTDTGANLGLSPVAQREREDLMGRAPGWVRAGRHLVVAAYRYRRWRAGHYRRRPSYAYAIYTQASRDRRVTFQVERPVARWRRVPAGG